MTEIGVGMTNPLDPAGRRPGSSGRRCRRSRSRIVDEARAATSHDGPGRALRPRPERLHGLLAPRRGDARGLRRRLVPHRRRRRARRRRVRAPARPHLGRHPQERRIQAVGARDRGGAARAPRRRRGRRRRRPRRDLGRARRRRGRPAPRRAARPSARPRRAWAKGATARAVQGAARGRRRRALPRNALGKVVKPELIAGLRR